MLKYSIFLFFCLINSFIYAQECPEHCNCDSEFNCISCKEGFFDISVNCTSACPDNCFTCDSAEECKECKTPFYGTVCENQCEAGCDTDYKNCDKTTGNCEKCVLNKYWGSKCQSACSDTCDYNDGNGCDKETSKCDKCISGYFGTLDCKDKCNAGCDLIQTDGQCDRMTGNCKCKTGFYFDDCSKTCSEISQGCLECTQDGKCTVCESGYYVDEGICKECSSTCIGCESAVKCDECKDETKYGDLCDINCPEHCKYTSGSRKCDRNNGTCSSCEPNFEGTKCENCISGKWSTLCNETCNEGCVLPCNRDNGTCTCKTGYYGDKCQSSCTDLEGCLECTQFDTKCTKCASGYYLLNGECFTCGSHCNECYNATHCVECKDETEYGDLCDLSCPEHCSYTAGNRKCDRVNGTCSSCEPNFKGTKCENCIDTKWGSLCNETCNEGCILPCVRDNGTCSCNPGYFGEKCESKCTDIIGCLECTEDGNCTKCSEEYFLEEGKCVGCSEHCDGCFNETYCIECKNETEYGDLCNLTCPEHCSYTAGNRKCDRNNGTCASCEPNFEGEKCENCISGKWSTLCNETCNEGCILPCVRENGTCSCKPGYFGDTCASQCTEIEGCLECEEGGNCTKCDINYYLSEGICLNCSSTCKGCYNASLCIDCQNETMYGDLCDIDCPQFCKYTEGSRKCERNGTCTACEEYFEGEQCENCVLKRMGPTCNENCSDFCDFTLGNCNRTTGACACQKGYYESDCTKKCSDKSEGCIECQQEDGYCTSCDSNYYLKDGQCIKCGDTCIECEVGGKCKECKDPKTYGDICDKECPIHCYYNGTGTKCNRDSGDCFKCENEYFEGNQCQNCVLGRWKENCTENCNEHCDLQKGNCGRTEGECICKTGFFTSNCSKACSEKSEGCLTCKQEDGYCTSCDSNYYLKNGECFKCGIHCNKCYNETHCVDCKNETEYGDLCELSCPEHCSYSPGNRKCDRNNGTCSSCEPNFEGTKCEKCVLGKFGSLCSDDCNEGCDLSLGNCEREQGNCKCKSGFYLEDCSKACPAHCDLTEDIKHCNVTTGNCPKCKRGFHGNKCEEECFLNCKECDQATGEICSECEKGFYGVYNCSIPCGSGCDWEKKNCEIEDGSCSFCVNNTWYGEKCEKDCSGCGDKGCNRVGKCANIECIEGKFGMDCSENCNCEDNINTKEEKSKACSRFSGICLHCNFGYYGKDSCKDYCDYKCQSLACCTFGEKGKAKSSLKFSIPNNNKVNVKIDGINFELEAEFNTGYPITLMTDKKSQLDLKNKTASLTLVTQYFGDLEISGDLYKLEVEFAGKVLPAYVLIAKEIHGTGTPTDYLPLGFYNQFTEDIITYEKEVEKESIANLLSIQFKDDSMNIIIGDIHEDNKKYYDKYYSCQIIKSEETEDIMKSDKSCYGTGIKLSNENEAFVLDSIVTFSFEKESSFKFNSNYTEFFKIHYMDQYCTKNYLKEELGINRYYCEKNKLSFNRIPNFGFVIENKVYYIPSNRLFKEVEKGLYKFTIDLGIKKKNANEDKTVIIIGKDFYKDKEYAAINNEEGKILVFNSHPEYYNDKYNANLSQTTIKKPLTGEIFAGIILVLIFIINVSVFICYWLYKKKKVKGKFLEVLN